jgi:hypothetical protein
MSPHKVSKSAPGSPTPPIIVDDNGDVEIYPTIEVACSKLEAIDVNENAYEVFDSRGRLLRVETRGYDVWDMQVVSDVPPQPAELERRLRRFIERVGWERVGLADFERASLPVLVERLLGFLGGR